MIRKNMVVFGSNSGRGFSKSEGLALLLDYVCIGPCPTALWICSGEFLSYHTVDVQGEYVGFETVRGLHLQSSACNCWFSSGSAGSSLLGLAHHRLPIRLKKPDHADLSSIIKHSGWTQMICLCLNSGLLFSWTFITFNSFKQDSGLWLYSVAALSLMCGSKGK